MAPFLYGTQVPSQNTLVTWTRSVLPSTHYIQWTGSVGAKYCYMQWTGSLQAPPHRRRFAVAWRSKLREQFWAPGTQVPFLGFPKNGNHFIHAGSCLPEAQNRLLDLLRIDVRFAPIANSRFNPQPVLYSGNPIRSGFDHKRSPPVFLGFRFSSCSVKHNRQVLQCE